jgi:hypothetical protein
MALFAKAPALQQPFPGDQQGAHPWQEVENRQLLSVNDRSRNHGTVQGNPTQARQIDIPVLPPDSEP